MSDMTTTTLAPTAPQTAAIEIITPEKAAEYLAASTGNRTIRRNKVAAYARDMKNSNWMLNGESIKFNVHGELIDGHHRLLAVQRSGVPLHTHVVRGLHPQVRSHIDRGTPRSNADLLAFDGKQNVNVLAAVVRIGVLVDLGFIEDSRSIKTGGGTYVVTPDEMETWLENNTEVEDIVNKFQGAARKLKLPPAAFCYAIYVLSLKDYTSTMNFVESMVNRMTEGPGDPRNALLDYTNVHAQDRLGIGEVLWLVFQTWNNLHAGKQQRKYQPFTDGGKSGRKIPTPMEPTSSLA